MRIGIDVTASIYTGTGVATYYQLLVPELLRIGREHEFVLLGYALRRFKDLTLANKRFRLPPRLMEFLWNDLHVLPVERFTGPIDVFHAWDYLQPPRKSAKMVTTVHDLTTLKFPMYHHPSTVDAQKRRLRWVKKEADLVIADSVATKQDLVELLGFREDQVIVIYLAAGKQFSEFRRRNKAFRDEEIERVKNVFGIEDRYILSLGTIEPRKNLKRVVDAFTMFHSRNTAVDSLIIAGQVGWGEDLKPAEGVQIIGKIPASYLPALYAGAEALVYASLYEGFGLPVLEAMAVECPVVVSDRGSLKEVAGNAAVLVDPENVDAIAFGMEAALLNRQRLVTRGLKQESTFSWQKTARETLGVYRQVAG